MIYKKLAFSILLLLIVCAIIWANKVNQNRSILISEDFNSLSLKYIELDSLKRNLKENKFIKDSLFNQEFSFSELERHINNIDFFDNSNVYKSIDAEINFQINEKNAIMLLEDQNKYVDSIGRIIPLSKIYKPETTRVIGEIDSINLIKAIKVSTQIVNDEFLFGHIDYIFMDSINIYLKPVNENFLIKLGNISDVSNKLDRYKIFYSAIHQSDLFGEIKNLNLSFENQVVIEKQKQ
tara:strand:- start:1282 stop:1992 length:711 start_codon:yes stop_codon:yes gene_type:complete